MWCKTRITKTIKSLGTQQKLQMYEYAQHITATYVYRITCRHTYPSFTIKYWSPKFLVSNKIASQFFSVINECEVLEHFTQFTYLSRDLERHRHWIPAAAVILLRFNYNQHQDNKTVIVRTH